MILLSPSKSSKNKNKHLVLSTMIFIEQWLLFGKTRTIQTEDWEEIYQSILIGYYTIRDNPNQTTAYLELMISNNDIEPNSKCYNLIIDSHAELGGRDCAKRTQEVLKILESCQETEALNPDERVYTSLIRVLTKGKVPDLHKKAELIPKKMQLLGRGENPAVEPTLFTYCCFECMCISAKCTYINNDTNLQEVFQTSVWVFTKLREDMEPDPITFGN